MSDIDSDFGLPVVTRTQISQKGENRMKTMKSSFMHKFNQKGSNSDAINLLMKQKAKGGIGIGFGKSTKSILKESKVESAPKPTKLPKLGQYDDDSSSSAGLKHETLKKKTKQQKVTTSSDGNESGGLMKQKTTIATGKLTKSILKESSAPKPLKLPKLSQYDDNSSSGELKKTKQDEITSSESDDADDESDNSNKNDSNDENSSDEDTRKEYYEKNETEQTNIDAEAKDSKMEEKAGSSSGTSSGSDLESDSGSESKAASSSESGSHTNSEDDKAGKASSTKTHSEVEKNGQNAASGSDSEEDDHKSSSHLDSDSGNSANEVTSKKTKSNFSSSSSSSASGSSSGSASNSEAEDSPASSNEEDGTSDGSIELTSTMLSQSIKKSMKILNDYVDMQDFQQTSIKSTFDIFNDITSDDEVHLVKIHKEIDPHMFTDKKIKLGKPQKISYNNAKFVINFNKDEDEQLCLIGTSGKELSLRQVLAKGSITINKDFNPHHVCKPIDLDRVVEKQKVPFPAQLTQRHPFFGRHYHSRIELDEKTKAKLQRFVEEAGKKDLETKKKSMKSEGKKKKKDKDKQLDISSILSAFGGKTNESKSKKKLNKETVVLKTVEPQPKDVFKSPVATKLNNKQIGTIINSTMNTKSVGLPIFGLDESRIDPAKMKKSKHKDKSVEQLDDKKSKRKRQLSEIVDDEEMNKKVKVESEKKKIKKRRSTVVI